MTRRPWIRAVVFDAGHTLLEMDYVTVTAYLRSRGHVVGEAAVIDAERRARFRLDVEQATQLSRERTGQGRYVRYLLDALEITDEAERRAVAEWRRGFNVPIGLCHRADREAAQALRHARDAGLTVGVISNSNGSFSAHSKEPISRHSSISSSIRAWSVSPSPIPASSRSACAQQEPAPTRRSTSGTRTSSTLSAPSRPAWAPCSSIRVDCGASAAAPSPPACARPSRLSWATRDRLSGRVAYAPAASRTA